ncbi:MAG: right-handed parallel beta-helix repeat-containing protein, partial [Dehalogenimonas sp.]
APSAVYVVEISTEDYYVDDNPNDDATTPMSINAAIAYQAVGGKILIEEGTFNENVVASKRLTIQGAGTANTLLNGAGTIVQLAAGTSNTDRTVMKDLSISGGVTGLTAGSYTTIDNVISTGNSSYGINLNPLTDLVLTNSSFNANNVGLKLASTASASNISISGCHFDNNQQGWYSDANTDTEPDLDQVSIVNTTFSGNALKGFYTERLSNAIFDGITVNNSGSSSYAWGAGIDINLKWKDYSNIEVLNSTFSNCGIGSANGVGLTIKARDDGSSYGANAATLQNVSITANSFSANNLAIAIGEPGKNNAGPTLVSISNNSLINSVTNEINNNSQANVVATCNWYGSPIDNTIASKISGPVTYSPYLISAGTNNNPGFTPDPGSCLGGPVVISSTSTMDATCGVNGSITVNYSGGTGDYVISWTGPINGSYNDTDGSPYIISLPGGIYSVTVTDSYGSYATVSSITVPYLPVKNNTGPVYFATIQAAVTAAASGDVLDICDGTYNERVVIDKPLTLNGLSEAGTILDGTGLAGTGKGITINTGIEGVTIQNLTVQNFAGASGNADGGIYAIGGNNNLTIQHVTIQNNVGGSGFYANGPVDNVLIDDVTSSGHTVGARGIVIWNGLKSNITITNCEVFNNNCCGIELQDGTASGVTMTGNNVHDNGDNGFGIVGMEGPGVNLIADNTVTDCGRFGIEIKNPNGSGLATGPGSIVVEDNIVSRITAIGDLRDIVGIAAFRRGVLAENVDVPTGVVIQNNTISGYVQTSTSDGFGIVVEGTNHSVLNNNVSGCDVGIQQQAGHLPYPGDGDQNNLADQYFGRGNSPVTCGITMTGNTYSSNGTDSRNVGSVGGAGFVVNTNTDKTFCSIQAAIDDAATLAGHTIQVSAGTFNESIVLNKSVKILGEGPTNTILTPTTACSGIGVSISAADAELKNLKVTNYLTGISVSSSDNVIENVESVSNCNQGLELSSGIQNLSVLSSKLNNNTSVGVRKGTAAIVNGFTMTNCEVKGNNQGFFIAKNNGAGGTFENVNITNSDLSNNLQKGMYFEALSNAVLDGIIMDNSGTDATYANNNGIDINLKYGSYNSITIKNSEITNCGSVGTATLPEHPAAIAVKARDDGGYAGNPATLDIVIVTNNIISGPQNGIRFGESGKINTGPTNVSVTGNDLSAFFAYKAFVNNTNATNIATCNWWGSPASGLIASKITGDVYYNPWYTTGGDETSLGFQPTGTCEGEPVLITSAVADHIICGEATGSITVTFDGGFAPYDITWTGGGSASGIASPFVISGLPAGLCNFTITDNNGSTVSGSVNILYLPVTNINDGLYFATIQGAIDAATTDHGDVIEVCAGTYTYLTEGSPAPSGLIKVTKGITLRAAAGSRPIIDGSGFDGVFKIHPSALSPGNTVIIEGFEITGNETTGIAMTMQGCFDVTPAKVIIRDNWFHGMVGGIDFWGAGAYLPSGWTSALANIEITG